MILTMIMTSHGGHVFFAHDNNSKRATKTVDAFFWLLIEIRSATALFYSIDCRTYVGGIDFGVSHISFFFKNDASVTCVNLVAKCTKTNAATIKSMMALLLKDAVRVVILIEHDVPFRFALRPSCCLILPPPRATDTNIIRQQPRETSSVGRAALVVAMAMVCFTIVSSCVDLLGAGHEWRTALWKDVRLLSTVLSSDGQGQSSES